MDIFREENGVLKVRYQGENLWLMPWGRNALRVCGRWMAQPGLRDWALLPQEGAQAQICIGQEEASIAVGDIRAVVRHAQEPDRTATIPRRAARARSSCVRASTSPYRAGM